MSDEGVTISATVATGSSKGPGADGDDERPVVAGYEVVKLLGRGGMGVVWEAVEHRFDRRVALKVHKATHRQDDLWSEAFVAARIADPSIVRVLDVGYALDERPYYAMELVEGTDLASLLAEGPLSPSRAVTIAADIARAASAAHEHGIIHRDLKPHNVIIDSTGRARVLDFGIALDLNAAVKVDEGLTGSPAYMAPEQVAGLAITPRTDIFAIGVILYEMLTGERPFTAESTTKLLETILTKEPWRASAKNPAVHEDIDEVIVRCLRKNPDERFPSARALFETLLAIGEGRTLAPMSTNSLRPYAPKKKSAAPPADRPRRDDARKRLVWKWQLASSPSALWPYVANTDRFNKAAGLAPVAFSDEPLPEGGVERTGELRVLGLAIRWREFPFEWVKDREHSVFRWYRSGPIAALWNKVTLTARDDGGTDLVHEIWLTPRGVLGQVAAFVEIERKLGAGADKFYRHLDAVLRSGGGDPFEPQHVAAPEQVAVAQEAARTLREDGFAGALVDKLVDHVLTAPDGVLGSLRPYELADAWKADRGEVFDLLVHAAHTGLLEPAWDVVCPKCLMAHESVHDLSRVTRVGTCAACASSFERDLRESVELAFTVHPSIRKIERVTYCAGAPALRPHVLAQVVLDPGEKRMITIDLPRGPYRVAGAIAKTPWELVASAVGFEEHCDVSARGERIDGRPNIVRAGTVTFALENEGELEETLRIEVPGARDDGVTAATAMTHPSFRTLFADQLLAHGEHVRVSQLAFVFVAPRGREALFERVGDAVACAELAKLDDVVREVARQHEGIAVPSSLDVLALAFPSKVRALRAALDVRARLAGGALELPVAVAAHDGRCIALTREGKAEFFGETLHRTQALLEDCPDDGIALSAAFSSDRAVAVAIHEAGLRVTVAKTGTGVYAGRRVTLVSPLGP